MSLRMRLDSGINGKFIRFGTKPYGNQGFLDKLKVSRLLGSQNTARATEILFCDTRDVVMTFRKKLDDKKYFFAEKTFSKIVFPDKISDFRTSKVDHRRNWNLKSRPSTKYVRRWSTFEVRKYESLPGKTIFEKLFSAKKYFLSSSFFLKS